MPGYRNLHALHHDRYLKGGVIKHEVAALERGARVILSKTKIVPNLARATVLLDVLERLPTTGDAESQQRIFNVFGLLTDCYEVIADDVLILSAFEIHAKAQLLRRGYVVHEIERPRQLGKAQAKSPIHVRTVRALARQGNTPSFRDTTIGVSRLLSPGYLRRFHLPSLAAENALREVQRRRNFVHFGEPYSWTVDQALLTLVTHLDRVIPQLVFRRPRRPRT